MELTIGSIDDGVHVAVVDDGVAQGPVGLSLPVEKALKFKWLGRQGEGLTPAARLANLNSDPFSL